MSIGEIETGAGVKGTTDSLDSMLKQAGINSTMSRADAGANHPASGSSASEYTEVLQFTSSGLPRLNQPAMVTEFQRQHGVIFQPGRGFYRYEASTGLWSRVTPAKIKKLLSNDLEALARAYNTPALMTKINEQLLTSLARLLEGQAEVELGARRSADVLHFENGMLDINANDLHLQDFDPEFYSTNAIPFPYLPDAECPRFMEMLERAVGPDDRQLLLKWLGLALTGRNFAQKILLLTGVGGAGKGVFVDIVTAIIGRSNCQELRTPQLNSRFELSRFIDKTLLIGCDVQGNFLNLTGAENLKKLTGGDHLDAESKGVNGSTSLKGIFNVLVTSNNRLRVRLDGDRQAWRRRLLKVDFLVPVERVNPDLAAEIIREEASGIINAALRGLELVRRGFKEAGVFRTTETQSRRVEDLLNESDSIHAFVKGEVEENPHGDVTCTELFMAYRRFCRDKSWAEQPKKTFDDEAPELIRRIYCVGLRKDIDRSFKDQRGYKGIALREGVRAGVDQP